MSGLLWRPKFTAPLTILSGRSYSEQGGYPYVHAHRNDKKNLILNEALDDTETGVDYTWTQASGWPAVVNSVVVCQAGTVIQIDSEQMLVTASTATSFTVTRAYAGTTGVAHSSGATIVIVTTGDGVIDMTGVSWMSITTPSTWTAADLAFFSCSTRDGTYVPMRDEVGVILSITTIQAAQACQYYVPGKVHAGGPFVRVRSITAGTDPTSAVNQGADKNLIVCGGE